MLCPSCGRDNPSNARFCGHCGSAQTVVTQLPISGTAPQSDINSIADLRMLTARLVQLGSEALKHNTRKEGDAESYLRVELMHLVLHFAALDGCISQGEARVYSEISNSLDPGLIDDAAGFLDGLMSACSPMALERPLLLSLIEEYDRTNKTNYAAQARNAFFQIASAVVSADGQATAVESAELDRYKQLLEPTISRQDTAMGENAPSPPTQTAAPRADEAVAGETTKLELLVQQFQSFSESLPRTASADFSANLRVDAVILAAAFSKAAGRVSDGTAGFVLCIIDGVSSVRALPEPLPGFVEDVRKMLEDDWKQVQPEPTVPLTIAGLLNYDQAVGTNYFETAWSLFGQLIASLAAEDPIASSATKCLHEKYRTLLGFGPETASSPAKSVNQTSVEVPDAEPTNLQRLAQEFLSLSRTVAPKVNEMLKSATILGPNGKPQDLKDFNEILTIDLDVLAAEFSKTAGVVSNATAEFIVSVMDERGAFVLASPSGPEFVNALKKVIEGQWKQTPASPGEPITVTILAMYDENCGTHYAEEARNLFSRLVSALAEEAAISGRAAPDLVERYIAILAPHLQKHAEAAASDTQLEAGADTFDALMAELQGLIGLAKVKNDVVGLANYIKVQQMRKSRGLKTPELSLHMVFYGNPGTGKTMVARLLAKIYKSLGVLTQGQLVETDRSGLVAGYVGQTALKVKEVVEKALGGVLFIDEAYALKPKDDSGDFGDEAVETLLKLMEDNRGNLIVIVAGYTSEMKLLLDSNPGLDSRFNKYLDFDDYSPDELLRIFQRFCSESQYTLDDEAASKLERLFESAFQRRDAHFGNARLARNAFEQAITNMATRIVKLTKVEDSTLEIIQATDIPDNIATGT